MRRRPAPAPDADTRKKGGRPGTDVALMARKLNLEIGKAILDPTRRVSKAEICRRAGVKLRTLNKYEDHPLIEAELRRLADLQEGRRSVRAAVAGAVGEGGAAADAGGGGEGPATARRAAPTDLRDPAARAAALDEIQMTTQYAQECLRAVEACMRFAGKHRRAGHVSDLPVAVRNLDITVGELSAALQTLRPLATEWVRRTDAELRPRAAPAQGRLL